MDARVKPEYDDLTTALEKPQRLAALAGLEVRLVAPCRNIDQVYRAVALAGDEQLVAVKRHVHGMLADLARACRDR
jgi:hypothetical protein